MKNNPWATLKQLSNGLDSARVDPKSKFDFFWAITKEGTYQFLIEHTHLEDWPAKKTTLSGINIQQFRTSKKFRIVLSLNEASDWDIFYILCDDLVHATENSQEEKAMLNIVYNRLLRWQKLFRKFGRKILSDAEQQGLIGELYFLKHYLLNTFSETEALSFWKGPHGEQQDFGLGSMSVEIKSKQGTSAPHIQINSIDQLESQLQDSFLFVVTLNTASHTSADAFCLNGIISEIKHSLSDPSDIDTFENLLAEAGYMELPEYSEKYYLISKEFVYTITDGFPRLRIQDLPSGIISVQYKIDIKECRPFEISLDNFRTRIMNEQ